MTVSIENNKTPRRSEGRWIHHSLHQRNTLVWARGRCELFWPLAFIWTALVVILGLSLCEAESTLISCTALLIVGQARTREAYRLSVRVDPKINAFLLMEKARTGMTIAEVVEIVFREYQRHRKEMPLNFERRKD